MRQNQVKKKWKMRDVRGLFYISPWIIGFAALQLYPFLSSLYYSFTQYNVLGSPKWVGLANYVRLFTIDPDFKKSILVTMEYALFSVPAKLIFALLIAIVLNMKLKGINLCRTVYYIPSILGGSVAVSALWRLMFMSDGILNKLRGFPLSTGWGRRERPCLPSVFFRYGSLALPWCCFWRP